MREVETGPMQREVPAMQEEGAGEEEASSCSSPARVRVQARSIATEVQEERNSGPGRMGSPEAPGKCTNTYSKMTVPRKRSSRRIRTICLLCPECAREAEERDLVVRIFSPRLCTRCGKIVYPSDEGYKHVWSDEVPPKA